MINNKRSFDNITILFQYHTPLRLRKTVDYLKYCPYELQCDKMVNNEKPYFGEYAIIENMWKMNIIL
jgi:hypothetical protein